MIQIISNNGAKQRTFGIENCRGQLQRSALDAVWAVQLPLRDALQVAPATQMQTGICFGNLKNA